MILINPTWYRHQTKNYNAVACVVRVDSMQIIFCSIQGNSGFRYSKICTSSAHGGTGTFDSDKTKKKNRKSYNNSELPSNLHQN